MLAVVVEVARTGFIQLFEEGGFFFGQRSRRRVRLWVWIGDGGGDLAGGPKTFYFAYGLFRLGEYTQAHCLALIRLPCYSHTPMER